MLSLRSCNHVLPLHSTVLQDQDSSNLPLTFSTEWQNDFAQSLCDDISALHALSRAISPCNAFTFPANIALGDSRYKNTFSRLSNTHIFIIIDRSSFTQSQAGVTSHALRCSLTTSSVTPNHAKWYFIDSAVAAIEKSDSHESDLMPVRDVFPAKWQEGYGVFGGGRTVRTRLEPY